MLEKLKKLFQKRKSELEKRIDLIEKNVIQLKEQVWLLDVEMRSKGLIGIDDKFAKHSYWIRDLEDKIKAIHDGTTTQKSDSVKKVKKKVK